MKKQHVSNRTLLAPISAPALDVTHCNMIRWRCIELAGPADKTYLFPIR